MDALLDEVESLEAILMDDVRISRNVQSNIPELIETTIFPAVDDESEQQYVCVTLQVKPPPGYPDIRPEFKLLRPRGLDDSRIDAIRAACVAKLDESIGFPVVFDLIEIVREQLSGSNLPSGQCVVCLYGFSDGDEFTRTECFHYLHSYCLARHLNALRRNYQEEYEKLPVWQQKCADPFQAACPVCREHIRDDDDSLKCAMPPAELENAPDFQLTRELRELQQRMSSLFLQQKCRGAIIDVDAETDGGVISIETEEEIRRRRLQEKRDDDIVVVAARDSHCLKQNGQQSMSTLPEQQKDIAAAASSTSNSHCIIPNMQHSTTPRCVAEPTNNNYQHNRRHFRGGRRHQHHHHHHHRERERYEHNTAVVAATTTTTAAAAAGSAGAGKQSKAQTHAR